MTCVSHAYSQVLAHCGISDLSSIPSWLSVLARPQQTQHLEEDSRPTVPTFCPYSYANPLCSVLSNSPICIYFTLLWLLAS